MILVARNEAKRSVLRQLYVSQGSGPTPHHDLARTLIMYHGWNTIACQILIPGIQHWFPPDQTAVVGYVESRRTWVVAGAPVAPTERLAAAAMAFESDAARRGRRVCYFGAQAPEVAELARIGPLARLLIGAQPVWDPQEWADLVARTPSLRAQIGRARKKGVQVAACPPALAARHPEVRRCLNRWLATRGLPPMGFLVTPTLLEMADHRRVFLARREGAVVAYLVATPVPGRQGWLFEQIVRGDDTPNGATELLIDTAMRTVAAEGARWATLGLVPLAQVAGASEPEPGVLVRLLLAWLRSGGRRLYNFAGLEAFRRRLRPTSWEPVYLLSRERRTSLATLYTVASAFSGIAPPLFIGHALLRMMARHRVDLHRLSFRSLSAQTQPRRTFNSEERTR